MTKNTVIKPYTEAELRDVKIRVSSLFLKTLEWAEERVETAINVQGTEGALTAQNTDRVMMDILKFLGGKMLPDKSEMGFGGEDDKLNIVVVTRGSE